MLKNTLIIFVLFNIFFLRADSNEDVGSSQKGERIVTYTIPQLNKYDALNLKERQMILNPSGIVGTLKIKPNMNILDIGAGSGVFTFRFAETLKGTGKVFATETDPEMIKYIKKEQETNRYKNIFSVYVRPEKLDPFYKQHTFDIIFICELYHILSHVDNYFQELTASLKQETGRLYIISFKNISNFSEVEFGDFKTTFKILVSEEKDFPILKRLSQQCQDYIRNWQEENIPTEIRTKFISDLNKLLPDRFLFNDLLNYYAAKENNIDSYLLLNNLDVYDLRLVQWLAAMLDEKRIFNESSNLLESDKRELLKLNRILITGIFKSTAVDSVKGFYTIFAERNSIISTMEKAGYQFVREYDSLAQYYFLEFKRSSQGK